MQILADKGYPVTERDITRSELYLADEVFMCGTAAEVVPVREIDDHPLGDPGDGFSWRVFLRMTFANARVCSGLSASLWR